MKNYKLETELVLKKLAIYQEIEQITDTMSIQNIDQLIDSVQKREKLIMRAEIIDDSLFEYTDKDINLKNALNIDCKLDDLNDELKFIYETSFKIKAIINRLLRNEGVIREYMEFQKDSLLQKIESLNQSTTSVASKYSMGLQTAVPPTNNSKKSRFI